ncbi:hypothetical protein ACMAZF_12235 [Psychrobium sp. nBUS_13]|uniref:hypothetical protein n=1 Tax=Psychrobium sp. nBUS_13 TaxID=3395319 RepID=UPI003EC0A2B4
MMKNNLWIIFALMGGVLMTSMIELYTKQGLLIVIPIGLCTLIIGFLVRNRQFSQRFSVNLICCIILMLSLHIAIVLFQQVPSISLLGYLWRFGFIGFVGLSVAGFWSVVLRPKTSNKYIA